MTIAKFYPGYGEPDLRQGLYLILRHTSTPWFMRGTHWGVFITGFPPLPPRVFHNDPKRGRPSHVNFKEWIDGKQKFWIERECPQAQWEDALARIKAASSEEYNLFTNNCEHFARWVIVGSRVSWQVVFYSAVAAAAVLSNISDDYSRKRIK